MKPLFFVSHIHEERELAHLVAEEIESSLLGGINCFLSSRMDNIQPGQRWLDQITGALNECSAVLVICSPYSLTRPWIYFESGAGWIRGIKVIPLCHSGTKVSELPKPLDELQALDLHNETDWQRLYFVGAQAADLTPPTRNPTPIIAKLDSFSAKYTYWSRIDEAIQFLLPSNEDAIAFACLGKMVFSGEDQRPNHSIEVNTNSKPAFDVIASWLTEHKVLLFAEAGINIGPSGFNHTYVLIPSENTSDILDDQVSVSSYLKGVIRRMESVVVGD